MARPLSETARQNALTAALEIVAEVGVGRFTVEAVAKRSGVAKTTIYRHWESVNHLLLAAMDQMIAPVPTPNTGSLRGDLIALYELFLPMMEDPMMYRVLIGMIERGAYDESFQTMRNELMEERHQPLRTVIELARGRGELPDDVDFDLALDLIEGPFAAKRLLHGELIPRDRVELYVDAIIHGLTGPQS